jgi:hypothetical protein
VAWESLPAHTMVRIQPKATPYNERIFIVTSDIKVCGVRDANGIRPKINGLNARVRNSAALQSLIGTPARNTPRSTAASWPSRATAASGTSRSKAWT